MHQGSPASVRRTSKRAPLVNGRGKVIEVVILNKAGHPVRYTIAWRRSRNATKTTLQCGVIFHMASEL